MQIIERIIEQNDKPRAEIVFDVEILEVDRKRAQDVRLEPVGVRDRRHLLARGVAERQRPAAATGTTPAHDGTTTTAPADIDRRRAAGSRRRRST